MNKIIAIPAFKDNYIWALHSPDETRVIVVDPGDASPVLSYLQNHNLTLAGILVTHHHYDHCGGVPTLMTHFPSIRAYGPLKEKVEGITDFVEEGDKITFAEFNLSLDVLDIPGHTLGHIAYVNEKMLFCGDTLFSCGCGRIFEGTPQQMYASLHKLKTLPSNIEMYCGHEYTLANIAFAEQVESNNKMLKNRKISAKKYRDKQLPSLPVSLATELETNPFLRCEKPDVIHAVQKYAGFSLQDPLSIFTALRQWKNAF